MSSAQTVGSPSGPSTALYIGETLLAPQQWCERQWRWLFCSLVTESTELLVCDVAMRITLFAPLVLLSALAYAIGFIGREIIACGYRKQAQPAQQASPNPPKTTSSTLVQQQLAAAPRPARSQEEQAVLDQGLRQRIINDGTADEVARLLATGADPKRSLNNPGSVVHLAVSRFRADLIPLLVQYGADVNEKLEEMTPLARILRTLDIYPKPIDVKVIEALVNAGAHTNIVFGDTHDSPVIRAILVHSEQLLDLFLKAPDIDVNHQNDFGHSPLSYALGNYPWALKKLLEKGARVKDIRYDGSSALHHCTDVDQVEQFIKMGVDINERDKNGHTSLEEKLERYYGWAKNHPNGDRDEECTKILEIMKKMLACGADPNCTKMYSKTDRMPLLAEAAKNRLSKAVSLLVEHPKIDLEAHNEAGHTAMIYAAAVGDTTSFDTLLRAGARFNPEQLAKVRTIATFLQPVQAFLHPVHNIYDKKMIAQQCTRLEGSSGTNPYLSVFCTIFPDTPSPINSLRLDIPKVPLRRRLKMIEDGVVEKIADQQAFRKSLLTVVERSLVGSNLPKEMTNLVVDYLQVPHKQRYTNSNVSLTSTYPYAATMMHVHEE